MTLTTHSPRVRTPATLGTHYLEEEGGLRSRGLHRDSGALPEGDTFLAAAGRLGVEAHYRRDRDTRLVSTSKSFRGVTASSASLADTPLSFLWFRGHFDGDAATRLENGNNEADQIAAAWHRGGVNALSRFYGDFVVVAVELTGRIVAAATPGLSPWSILCTSARPNVFAWATHPLLLLDRAPRCDQDYFSRWFRMHPTGQLTPYEGVQRVPGGHCLYFDPSSQGARLERWWKPAIGSFRLPTERDYQVALREELSGSVCRATRGESTVAISLSSGIDSCSIAVCAKELVERGALERVVGLTFSTAENLSDESTFASAMAAHIGIPHNVVPVPTFSAPDELFAAAARIGFPTGHLLFGTWHRKVAEAAAANGASVILNGVGAEILHCEVEDLWAPADGLPALAQRGLSALRHVGARPLGKAWMASLRQRPYRYDEWAIAQRKPWIRPASVPPLDAWTAPSPMRRMDRLVTMIPNACESHERAYLHDLPIVTRVPYLDRRFMELAYSYPHWLRLRRTSRLVTKKLARDAFPEIPTKISIEGTKVNLNHAVAQNWRALFDGRRIGQLIHELPSSFDASIQRDLAIDSVQQLSDAQAFISVHELGAIGVWAAGMRAAGWSLV